jgi:hypothetical protein
LTIQATLPDLAERINAEHAACLLAARDAVARAIEVGRLLVEAKAHARHGQWADWISENCSFGLRQAQNYMRAYRNRDRLEDQMRSGDSHLEGLHGAVAMLAEPRIDIEIDPEFSTLLPPLRPREFAGLEASILAHGCMNRLCVWAGHNILLDGHARLAICRKHRIDFKTVEIELEDRDHAAVWIMEQQLMRSNLTEDQIAAIELRVREDRAAQDANDVLPLSAKKQADLARCEGIIKAGLSRLDELGLGIEVVADYLERKATRD